MSDKRQRARGERLMGKGVLNLKNLEFGRGVNKEERIKILRFPSILGRDVINKFRLIFDKGMDEISLKARK